MYDCTITLFNYHKSGHSWYTTVFQGVSLIEPHAKAASVQGQMNADTAEIIIRASPDKSVTVDGVTRQYVAPKAFAELEAVNGRFTFTPGSDFIIVGNHAEAEPIDDSDYDEGLYQYVNDTMDDVYLITSAAWLPLIPHFEVGGR